MNFSLDSTARAAEIVGAIGVVVGILFVGFEIRGNTVAQQFSATQLLVSEYNAAIMPINDPEFICIYIQGSRDFNGLSQKNKIRFSILLQPVFRNHEQLYYSAMLGTIDPNVYAGFQGHFAAVMQVPGYQQWWAARRDWFGIPFQEHVDRIISDSHSIEPANFGSEECE